MTRQFFVREYTVNSRSMEPTIRGRGETVLVVFGSGRDLERFDLVAVRGGEKDQPLVKRVVGLSGEELLILRGDVWIDGEVLGPEHPRPAPIPVFDDRFQEVEDWFQMGSYRGNPWTRHADGWELDATDIPRGWDGGMMMLKRELRDGYLDLLGEYVPGTVLVHDAIFGCEVRLGDPAAALRFKLHDLGDVFEVLIKQRSEDNVLVSLVHRFAGQRRPELISVVPVSWPAGEWREIRFSNIDDALSFRIDGREVLAHQYEGNVQHPADIRQGSKHWRSYGPRVSFGGVEGRARFRNLRVWRDLHYVSHGAFGLGGSYPIGPDEIFVLGDNSAFSHDGRHFGSTPIVDVFGRPRAVIWPLKQMRRLHGAQARPAASDSAQAGGDSDGR